MFSSQWPLKLTSLGGARLNPFVAQALSTKNAAATATRMMKPPQGYGGNFISKSACRVMRARSGAQIIGAAQPNPAFEGLEANTHTFGPAHGLRAAGNLTVCQVGFYQVHQ